MSILDSLLGNVDGIAEKLGVPADKAQSIVSSLSEKLSGDGDKTQAIKDLADEHGVSVDGLKDMLGGEGEGGLMDKITGFLDKDGDGSIVDDLGDMAKGLFGKK
ncbi:MAG: hypothetical protein V3V15_08015 [Sphingorhabdus sp.]